MSKCYGDVILCFQGSCDLFKQFLCCHHVDGIHIQGGSKTALDALFSFYYGGPE